MGGWLSGVQAETEQPSGQVECKSKAKGKAHHHSHPVESSALLPLTPSLPLLSPAITLLSSLPLGCNERRMVGQISSAKNTEASTQIFIDH